MKLQPHHIAWLERNDGKYAVIPTDTPWIHEDGKKESNKCSFVFKGTHIGFNPKGLAQAIDNILSLYPES